MYRKHDNNRKRRSGTVFMLGGLLLFAAALFLTGYNLWDEQRAGDAVAAILEQMSALQGRAQEGLGATGARIKRYRIMCETRIWRCQPCRLMERHISGF